MRSDPIIVIAAGAIAASTATAAPIWDDFESYPTGALPSGPWQDVTSRIDNPTVPSPTARVVSTTGPDGLPTKAVQIIDAIGSSSGVLAEVEPAPKQILTMDVRIDQYTNASYGWPGGIGFLQDMGAEDLNIDPQIVLYAWTDRRWHLFVKNSLPGGQGFDVVIPRSPIIQLGKWYTLELEIDNLIGEFIPRIFDASTGALITEQDYQFGPGWNPALAQFDAIAAFDGEGISSNGTHGGISTYDNVNYIPTPATALLLLSACAAPTRRRR